MEHKKKLKPCSKNGTSAPPASVTASMNGTFYRRQRPLQNLITKVQRDFYFGENMEYWHNVQEKIERKTETCDTSNNHTKRQDKAPYSRRNRHWTPTGCIKKGRGDETLFSAFPFAHDPFLEERNREFLCDRLNSDVDDSNTLPWLPTGKPQRLNTLFSRPRFISDW